MTKKVVFTHARVFDGNDATLQSDRDVVVEDGIIRTIAAHGVSTQGAELVDCAGRVLMPGMIDAHTHIYAASLNLPKLVGAPHTYPPHFATQFLRHSISSGFTTIRDVAGGDIGAARALAEGLVAGPRLFYGGRALTQTGGHGDFRAAEFDPDLCCRCSSGHSDLYCVVTDGVDAVRVAAREQLRRGASHIKIMASGGIISPNDPIDRCQFSDDEIEAAVDEATRWGAYVAAHCHPAEAVRRSVELGVRSIEHGTLIDAQTADLVATRGAFVVPTLAGPSAFKDDGLTMGLPPASHEKLLRVYEKMLNGIEIMKRAGVQMGFGTDLLGAQHTRQCSEFILRSEVLGPLDILRSACSVNAALLQQSGRLGCVAEGAEADLLVVDGNPLEDISLLAAGGTRLCVIMQSGKFYKRTI
jgi:imidazolonepropionase-like amidohydrolase